MVYEAWPAQASHSNVCTVRTNVKMEIKLAQDVQQLLDGKELCVLMHCHRYL